MEDTARPRTTTAQTFAVLLTLDSTLGLSPELRRFAAGLALSASYGVAVGARDGGSALVRNALGVPLGLAALCAVMLPSLTVLFAILDTPVGASRVLGALARAAASVGLVLAGLAPGVAMLSVSVESPDLARAVAGVGLVLAGALGLVLLAASFGGSLAEAERRAANKGYLLLAGYAVFTLLLGARLFGLFVPVLGGAS
jgi:hypothetical protein